MVRFDDYLEVVLLRLKQGKNVAQIQSPLVWAWKDGENSMVFNLAARDATSIPQD